MNAFSKILASYYLAYEKAVNEYDSKPRYDYGPYGSSFMQLCFGQIFSALLIMRVFCKIQNIKMTDYLYVIVIIIAVIFSALYIAYPENKVSDLVDEFRKQPVEKMQFWKRIAIAFLAAPPILFVAASIFLK